MRYANPAQLRRMFRELPIDPVSGLPRRDQCLARQGVGLHASAVLFVSEIDLVQTIGTGGVRLGIVRRRG
jgi:hypothetical protein